MDCVLQVAGVTITAVIKAVYSIYAFRTDEKLEAEKMEEEREQFIQQQRKEKVWQRWSASALEGMIPRASLGN